MLLTIPLATAHPVGGHGAARILACAGVTLALLTALAATTRLWRPYLGPWALLMSTFTDRRLPACSSPDGSSSSRCCSAS